MSERDCIREILLSEYIDGELGEGAARQIEDHLSACPKCSAAYESMRSDRDLLLQSLPGAEPPAHVKHQLFTKIEAGPAIRPSFLPEWVRTGQILPLRSRSWIYACVSIVLFAVVISALHFQRRMENGRLLAEIDRSKAEWVARGKALNPFDIDVNGAPLRLAAENPFKAYLNEH